MIRRTFAMPLALMVGVAALAVAADLSNQGFVTEAAQASKAEVELGRLAIERSRSAAVKSFAERMVTDHGKANQELESLAKGQGIELPTSLSAEQTAAKEKLMKLTGAAFDDAYAAQMVVDHEKAVTLFKQAFAAETLADDFRTFAQKTLPTLQHHHQEASELQSKLKTASR